MLAENYGTLSETINAIKAIGYTVDFNVYGSDLVCNQTKKVFSPEEFIIDMVYRFEGESNPDDQAILYALSSLNQDVKGFLVNGYGISANEETNELISKLNTHPD